jgi:hypothetical protein
MPQIRAQGSAAARRFEARLAAALMDANRYN